MNLVLLKSVIAMLQSGAKIPRETMAKITGTVCALICRMAVVNFPTMRQSEKQKAMPSEERIPCSTHP